MKKIILLALLLQGCAVYNTPGYNGYYYEPSVSYVVPAPRIYTPMWRGYGHGHHHHHYHW